MRILYSQTSLNPEQIKNMDIIHDPNSKSFQHLVSDEPTYMINNFISEEERIALIDFYFKTFLEEGHAINNVYRQVIHPLNYSLVSEILKSKIHKELGDDIIMYADIMKDQITVGDHFFRMKNAYTVHTDAITHIPGYVPYKDLVLPLEIHNDAQTSYYTCNQRYYNRATHFKRDWINPYFANYANIFRCNPYEEYGMTNAEYDENKMINEDWHNEKMSMSPVPYSVFQGLSIEKEFDWIPGSAIFHDASVLHGPTDFRRNGAEWKLGITFHFLKRELAYGYEMKGHDTLFSRYTKSFNEVKEEDMDKSLSDFLSK